MSDTIWKPIPGHVGKYEVSSTGYVRTAARVAPRGICAAYTFAPRLLRKVRGGRAMNYHRVMLMNPKRFAYVHVLVLESFVGPRPDGCVACHRNDEGFDNRLDNLYWGTVADNLADAARNRRVDPVNVGATDDVVPF